MNDVLFFIRLITRAIEQSDPGTALKAAIQQIEHMGREPQYRTGYLQFQRFMEEVVWCSTLRQERCTRFEKDLVQAVTIDLAAGVLEADPEEERLALGTIRSHPRWMDEYESRLAQLQMIPKPTK